MKKLATALVFLLLLCSCQKVEVADPPVPPGLPESGAASGSSPQAEYVPATVETGELRAFSDKQDYCVSGKGLYTFQSTEKLPGVLLYADFAAHTQTPLCTKSGCTHSDASCGAWFDDTTCSLVWAAGKLNLLYLGYSEVLEPSRSNIVQMDGDGKNRRDLYTLPEGETIATAFATDDKTLFLRTYRQTFGASSAVPGQTEILSEEAFLVGVDLATGEEVYRRNSDLATPVGVIGGDVVLKNFTNVDNLPYFETVSLLTLSTNAEKEMLEGPGGSAGEHQYSQCIKGAFYGQTGEDGAGRKLVKTDVLTGEVTPLLDPVPGLTFSAGTTPNYFDGKLFGSLALDNPLRDEYGFVDTETGEWTEYPLFVSNLYGSHEPAYIVAEYEDMYVVITGADEYSFNWTTDAGEVLPQTGRRNTYALIEKDDFWAGTANLLPIKSNK